MTSSAADISQKELPAGWKWVKLGEVCKKESVKRSRIQNPEHLEVYGVSNTSGIVKTQHEASNDLSDYLLLEPNWFAYNPYRINVGSIGLCQPPLKCLVSPAYVVFSVDSQIVLPSLLLEFLKSTHGLNAIARHTRGTVRQSLRFQDLCEISFPLPPIQEQKRIAGILNQAYEAKKAAEERLEAAQTLMQVSLKRVFDEGTSGTWAVKRLDECIELKPARSISSSGDTSVLTVTSGCISEFGFSIDGLKDGLMHSDDVPVSTVLPGEILINRSNTIDLVGRASMFPPNINAEVPVVTSDLTIRISSDMQFLSPEFLFRYLSYKFLSGHWRSVSRGTNVSMAKITRKQLLEMPTPVPTLDEQFQLGNMFNSIQSIVSSLVNQVRDIESLQSTLTRRAFAGEL